MSAWLVVLLSPLGVRAQVAVSANDGKSALVTARDSAPSHVVFTPDARALVTRNADSLVSVLAVSGTTVTYTKQDIPAGLKPYGIDVTGRTAIVANIGNAAAGGTDTLSVIDLGVTPPRTVRHVAVGPIPEGMAISPQQPIDVPAGPAGLRARDYYRLPR